MAPTISLSEHVKRYGSASPQTLEKYVALISETFQVNVEVTEDGRKFLIDTIETLVSVINENREKVSKEKVNQSSVPSGEQLPMVSQEILDQLRSMSVAGSERSNDHIEKIKLNQLVKKPRYFDGSEPLPREWIEEYKDAIEDNHWSDATAIYYFKHFLTKDAATWFKLSVRPLIEANWKWNDLFKKFEENYLGRAEENRIRALLRNLRMKREDRANNFIPKVRQYLLLLTPNMSEREQVDRIAEKMRGEFAPMITDKEPETIDELTKCCRKVEAARDIQQQSYASVSRNFEDRRQPKPREGFNSLVKKTCHRCGRNNHLKAACVARTKLDGTILPPLRNVPEIKGKVTAGVIEAENESEDDPNKSEGDSEDDTVEVSMSCMAISNQPQQKGIRRNILCNGVLVQALIDGGSTKTIINAELIRKNNWPMRQTKQKLIAANGQQIDLPGCCSLNLSLQLGYITKSKCHTVQVAENLPCQMLLGADLIIAFEILMDMSADKVWFKPSGQMKGLSTINDTIIPARSRVITPVHSEIEGKIMATPFNFHNDIAMAFSLDETKDSQSRVLLLNKSEKEVMIPKGTKVASYEIVTTRAKPTDNQSCCNLTMPLPDSMETIHVGDSLNEDQLQNIRQLLDKYKSAFSLHGELGCSDIIQHTIELEENAKPIVEPMRRRSQAVIEETKRQIQGLLKENIIEESTSPWASAYVLAPKKNGEWRLCIDFRRLNSITKKNVFPLPRIDYCLEILAGKSYYSQFDFASGYWQVEVEPSSRKYTSFRTEDGLYQFRRMPFGLTNAPATFQRLMNTLLAGVKGLELQVYLDDACIASSNWQEHLNMLEKFFTLVVKSKLKLKGSKCVLGATRVLFLGHEIDRNGIRQDPKKTQAIQNLAPPKDVKDVKRIMGLMSYYQEFIPRFSTIAAPILDLASKKQQFQWTAKEQESFEKLKQAFIDNAVLAAFNNEDAIKLKTDASYLGLAGILLQKQKDKWQIVACCSRRLSKAEKNYGITDLECAAIIFSVQKFSNYLQGREFEIATDHNALSILMTKEPKTARLRRWAYILSEYNFKVTHVKGSAHADVDCLSRQQFTAKENDHFEDCVYAVLIPIDTNDWAKYDDPESSRILSEAEKGEEYEIKGDLVYKGEKLYVPPHKREAILKEAHDSRRGGHGGQQVTLGKLQGCWWPSITRDVEEYVNSCSTCQTRKIENIRWPSGQYRPFETTRPLQLIAIDTFGKIPRSIQGFSYVIVIVDVFTRFVDARPTADDKGFDAALFLREFCSRFGPPEQIVSDNGPQFVNDLVNDTIQVFGIQRRFSSPDHSQGNAPAERAIRTFEEKLNLLLADQATIDKWDTLVPAVVLAMNSSQCASTGYSPYELMFGRKLNILDNEINQQATLHDTYNELLKNKLDVMFQRAHHEQTDQQERNKRIHNQRHTIRCFTLGQKVLARDPNKRRGKLDKRFLGPYEIIGIQDDNYTIKDLANGDVLIRHAESLKPFRERPSMAGAAIAQWA